MRGSIGKALRVEILDDIIGIATRATERLCAKLDVVKGTGASVDMENEFRLLTLQVIGEAILSLSPEESDELFPSLYLPIMDECNARSLSPWRTYIPSAEWFAHRWRVRAGSIPLLLSQNTPSLPPLPKKHAFGSEPFLSPTGLKRTRPDSETKHTQTIHRCLFPRVVTLRVYGSGFMGSGEDINVPSPTSLSPPPPPNSRPRVFHASVLSRVTSAWSVRVASAPSVVGAAAGQGHRGHHPRAVEAEAGGAASAG